MESQGVPDEVPAADAVEQRQDAVESVPDEEASVTAPENPPLEATDSDWQEQREIVDPEPDLEAFDRDSE